jgi:hypothetical protein
MSKVLTTFSGRFGDILWSLPTVRAIYQMVGGEKVDFGIMPPYRSLLSLLQMQPYIDEAFVIENWACEGSPFADQPWQPPKDAEAGYERCFHLTYRCHPGIHRNPQVPLIDFTAEQQGIKLRDPIPFIEASVIEWGLEGERLGHVAIAFSDGAPDLKKVFMDVLQDGLGRSGIVALTDVTKMSWPTAAAIMRDALCVVGSRSSNNVIAHGVGQKKIFIYEPESSRHAKGPFGICFGSPYTEEVTHELGATPEQAAELAIRTINVWQEQSKLQEVTK